MTDTLNEVLHEQRMARASLRETVATTRRISQELNGVPLQASTGNAAPLLVMAESLIATHKAAKVDNDGYTLGLIEDALFHVGRRLAAECPGR